MWTRQQLEGEIDDVRARIARHRRELANSFVNRAVEVDLMTVCAAAQERCRCRCSSRLRAAAAGLPPA